MKNLSILSLIVVGLVMFGCAKKKVEKKMDTTPSTYNSTTKNSSENTTINGGFENVDRFGGGFNSGGYNYDNGGEYSNGSRGYGNSYGDSANGIKNIYFGIDKYAITPDKLTIIINNAKILSIKKSSSFRCKGKSRGSL